MICTWCKNELNDIWVNVSLKTFIERVQEDSTIEAVKNSEVISQEKLCPDCFERFCAIIEDHTENV